uniref:Protein FAM32A n=1 Tax=Aplanochytrium stocchinoi TaxID=215587 RepID=A0A7S3V0M6_9STRA|mmetsp:Transcript_12876/g.14662  ORF Transcript_12876/g.14662 Transcript_12876/m.14662 type:complete len:150 (-) Transcript_12876:241-690(-)
MATVGEESEVYDSIQTGKLSLKGGLDLVGKGKRDKAKKKKKKKKKKDKHKHKDHENQSDKKRTREEANDEVERKKKREYEQDDEDGDEEEEYLTAAQRKFQEIQKKREKDLLARMVSKTHRERINEFNDKLASLSEHHDVPKVGNAGMG